MDAVFTAAPENQYTASKIGRDESMKSASKKKQTPNQHLNEISTFLLSSFSVWGSQGNILGDSKDG